ncbi:acyltransferase domain-containing protein [Clostridium tagluense]|uniref:type I polyketide synthase n=1 Tax=Clostridium tagluense TaxID=360422 RepID=UPI001CF176E8|nr:type I polyketide synthase [Clostridium tagluense]MCB2311582.1 acyltransferase domain-containing protein [Clostridium tagluense]MCB2316306.1 acyltransferase domain-containing protein [Clostridium tagluense]MCB2321161.1 acyltransferase domain-containing protein [Clostridium tagluense]MCB2326175.1 acyltransferase domain-containing protein [Clostridium tagluense]MCB2330898.1 acyltransferase domain-containing protein [Clostridium tagluense]
MNENTIRTGLEIAIIGVSGKFASADNINDFWELLKEGKEVSKELSKEELEQAGVSSDIYNKSNYVRTSGGIINNREFFDADFFGYSAVEAEIMNPQCRIAHEYAWSALEDAGYNPHIYKGKIGNYWGSGSTNYWELLVKLSGKVNCIGEYASWLLSSRDFLSTRLSYKLNLKGPSINLNTACSTSLAALNMACFAILTGQCDMAMVGSVSVSLSSRRGYEYKEGMISSVDGHCRAFDANASGTVSGEGVGVIILKSLEDAIEDNDHIYAIVKGSAINNDGNLKAGYTAPSVTGEKEVIKEAMSMAEIDAESISYVETHGTGTILGDPIEIDALTKAFSLNTDKTCAIGSVKTNIGHLDVAAGMAGLIKTILCLKHKMLPASINYEIPNPNINFENSPFYVNTKLRPWVNEKYPLRAGVSSFGIGGTNAHVILEEAPALTEKSTEKENVIIFLSAKSELVLSRMSANLACYLNKNKVNLEDMAYTFLSGRKRFACRKMFVCDTIQETIELLETGRNSKVSRYVGDENKKKVVFMFPGQGFQYIRMALGLYKNQPVFQKYIDQCFEIIQQKAGYDLKNLLFSIDDNEYSEKIIQTVYAQPIIFSLEYSLAMYLMSLNIIPYAMIGHSLGEYVAATISGVFTLENALKLVIFRGEIMQSMPKGVMVCINMEVENLNNYLNDKLSLVAVNSKDQCVVSGDEQAILDFEATMQNAGYKCIRLKTSHAFHSYMMDSGLDIFKEFVDSIPKKIPKIPYISNVNGEWITYEQALDSEYWVKHLRKTVQFKDGLEKLIQDEDKIFIEIGAGRTLSTFARKSLQWNDKYQTVNMLKGPRDTEEDYSYFLHQLGLLWMYGINVEWDKFFAAKNPCRVSLPTYAFDRKRYWIDYDIEKLSHSMKESTYKSMYSGHEFENEDYINQNAYPATQNTYQETLIQNEYINILVEICKQHFGIKDIDVHRNFFDMGASSLDIAYIKSQIENRIHKTFPVTVLYDNPNIYELCTFLINVKKSEQVTDTSESNESNESVPINTNNKLAQRKKYINTIGE